MENTDTPQFYNDQLEALRAPFDDKRQEMTACLKEMRRMFSALKTKVKKYEKIIAALDEATEKSTIWYASNNAQMAMNKFEGIHKKTGLCTQWLKDFEKHYKELPKYFPSDHNLKWKIDQINRCHSEFKSAMFLGEDMMRIANKHLKKNDEHFAYARRSYRRYHGR